MPLSLSLIHICLFYLEQVLGAYRKAAQTEVQVLRRVGGVAHGKAADGHRDVVRICLLYTSGTRMPLSNCSCVTT